MVTTTVEYYPVWGRLQELGCKISGDLSFLPDNFHEAATEQDFLIRGESTTLTKILKAGGLNVGAISGVSTRTQFIHNKSHDWAAPILFFAAEALKDNPDLPSVAIDLMKGYLSDMFKGMTKDKMIKAEFVIEKTVDGTFQKITYDGNADGLDKVIQLIRDVHAQS